MRFIPAPQGRLVSNPPAPVESAPADPASEPRARIVAALHRRGEGGAVEQPAPDLPAHSDNLPADDTRAPQDRFSLAVQREFLEALSIVGSVRDAARRVGVSHMTAYRARRKCATFRRCWDAAVVVAIPHAEEELTCRAIDGVEEDVMYRGEVVHVRIRKDSRLLLAHLGRLDKKAAQPQAAALAECFDDALEALGRGEDLPETAPETATEPAPQTGAGSPAETPEEVSSSGQCNMCNTSPAQERPDPLDRPCDCPGARQDGGGGPDHWRMGSEGPEPVTNIFGEGPCCNNPNLPECRGCPHFPAVEHAISQMDEVRPEDAPDPQLMGEAWEVDECQASAFMAGDEDWWRYGAGFVFWEKDGEGKWHPSADGA